MDIFVGLLFGFGITFHVWLSSRLYEPTRRKMTSAFALLRICIPELATCVYLGLMSIIKPELLSSRAGFVAIACDWVVLWCSTLWMEIHGKAGNAPYVQRRLYWGAAQWLAGCALFALAGWSGAAWGSLVAAVLCLMMAAKVNGYGLLLPGEDRARFKDFIVKRFAVSLGAVLFIPLQGSPRGALYFLVIAAYEYGYVLLFLRRRRKAGGIGERADVMPCLGGDPVERR